MKKYLELATGVMAVVGTLAVTPVYADTACTGATAASSQIQGAATAFIQVTFTARCSANVFLQYSQNTTVLAVAAASRKGKNYFSGHSNGGGITTNGVCAGTGGACEESVVGTKAGDALTAGSST